MRSNAPVSGQAHSNVEKPIAVAGELVQHVKERRYIDECVIIGLHDEVLRHSLTPHAQT